STAPSWGGAQRPPERPPRPAGWSPTPSPSGVPTAEPGAPGDPEGSAAALAFLQTGDAQRLAQANCSRGVPAGAAGLGPPPALRATLRAAPEALAHAANFLNMLFQTNDIREASVAEDVEWYQALVRSLAEGHPWVRRAVLALDAHPLAAKPRLMLQATKGDGEILLQDVSAAAPSLGNLSWDNEWFNALKSQRTPPLRKRVLSNDLRSMETPKWQQGDSYVGEPGHVRWSPPFLECRDGRFLPAWVVTLSSAFYGLKPDLSPEFKGVVRVDIELRDVAIDQCASGPGWFADTHRCDLNSTQCVPQESRGFVLGMYLCRCKPGFYGAGGVASGARAGMAGADGGSRLACRPCRQGCATCEDDVPCLIQEDRALRAAVLSCQACCMLAVFLSMLVSYHFRRSKRIRASGVVLLETILFGSLLLYFPVFILYFKPSIFRCIVLRWVRMLGFTIVYGTITLKLYRVLKVFLSRTAQRVHYMSSGRVLKMLGLILLLVLWFLAAWTIGMLENADKNIPLVIRTQTTHGLHFYICSHDRWDYMMVIAEMLFLLWGSFLCYATRAVPSAFHEPRYMGIALHNELMISAAFHVVRFIMAPSLHPDWTLLLFFAHTHGTITMTLVLLFIPKFLHAGSPLREEIAAEVYEDELDMRHSGSCLNSSIASAWSEHSLDPDDIREELKKLYMQLEAHKTWRMAASNPHLPKKRSSRRSLGRSILRRVAELPEAVAHRGSGGERGVTPTRRGSSAKRLPDAGGASLRMRDDGSRRRATALRKSRSTEGPTRVPRGGSPTSSHPGEPAGGRKMMAATASEQSDSESLDAAPLVCKSASAHNLAGHGQPPLPRAAPLQKSLSVVAGAWDEALLAASQAAREEWHANRTPSAPASGPPSAPASGPPTRQGPPEEARKPQSPSASLPGGSSPAEGGSQEDTSPPWQGAETRHLRTHQEHQRRQLPLPRAGARGCEKDPTTPPPSATRAWGNVPHQLGTAQSHPRNPWHRRENRREHRWGWRRKIRGARPPWGGRAGKKLPKQQSQGPPVTHQPPPPSFQLSSQKSSIRGLGLAIKAFNRSRGKSTLKGKREGEGSLRKRGREREGGSRRERPNLAETAVVSLGGISQDPAAKSPEWSRQRPGSEPPAHSWQGAVGPCQHNNNAGTAREAAGSGDGGAGPWDSPAPGDGGTVAEEPSAPWGEADAGGGLEPSLGVHKVPPSVGHQGAEHPRETPVVAGSGRAQTHPQQGAEDPTAELGKDTPAAIVRLMAPKEGGASRSIHPWDHAEVERPHAKPAASSPCPAPEKPGAEVCPHGAPGVPPRKGALLHQQAIASREDIGVPLGKESLAKALEKGGSQPEPLSARGAQDAERVPARSRSVEVALAAAEKCGSMVGRQAGVRPEDTQADSTVKTDTGPWEGSEGERWEPGRALRKGNSEGDPQHQGEERGTEKPAKTSGLPQVALEKAGSVEGRRAEVCPWETGERGRTIRAETCPWDAEGAEQQRERQDEERRQPAKRVKSVRPKSLGLPRAQDSGSSLRAAGQPWGSASSEGPPPKPAPRSSELPEVTSRSPTRASVCPWEVAAADSDAEVCPREKGTALPNAGKLGDGEISQAKNGISPHKAAPRSTGETAAATAKESGRWGPPCPGEGAEQLGTGLTAKHPALPKTSSEQAGTIDSKKANICPWEAEDEPRATTEICPWEEPAAPLRKDRPSQDMHGISKGENKPGSRGLADTKAKLTDTKGHQPVCRDTGILGKLISKSLESTKTETKKNQSVESIKDKVCSWESLGTEQPPAKPHARSPEMPKSPSKKSQSVESLKAEVCPWEAQELEGTDKAEICPWESLGTEQPPAKPRTGSPDLTKLPSKKSQSVESLKAEVCPWEAQELKATDKAEICPWEAAVPPSSKEKPRQGRDGLSTVSKSPSTSQDLLKEMREKITRKKEKSSADRESICPWESLGTEQPPAKPRTGSPDMTKLPSKKSQSVESLKAEVCPWEAQELKATNKAEICPWESLGTEQPPAKPHAQSPEMPKSPSKKSQSVESLKAEVCPWEAQELEATDKAEICPWEVAVPPSSKEKPRQGREGLSTVSKSPSTSQDLLKEVREQITGKKEKSSADRESICPWESLGMEQPPAKPRTGSPDMTKLPSKKSQSVESLKAEVCPWEAQELEATDKAEICPWEAAVPPSSKEKPRQGREGLSTVSKSPSTSQDLFKEMREKITGKKGKSSADRESICPWESLGTEQPPAKPRTGSPDMTKLPSKKSQSVESLKAEVCPWEAQELEGTDKAEICPWEVAAPPSAQPKAKPGAGGSSKGEKRITRQAALASPERSLEKGSSEREAVCPWESLGTEQPPAKPRTGSPDMTKLPSKKSQSVESLKAEVCPWEAQEAEATNKTEICPWEAAVPPSSKEKPRQDREGLSTVSKSPSTSQDLLKEVREKITGKKEKSSADRESICPWESLGTEQPPAKPCARSPDLPKSPSKKSQSVESLKAEVCPWEAQELEATNKAEICPWESLGTEQPPAKPRTGSPAMPKSPSKKSQSVESLKAEVCPWEAQELEGTDKAEICPWEAAVPPSSKEKPRQDREGLSTVSKSPSTSQDLLKEVREKITGKKEKSSADRESICPWESLGTEQPPAKPRARSPDLPKSHSKKSQSVESLKAEVCPWEAQELEATDKAEICPWEAAVPPSSKEKPRQGREGLSTVSKSPSTSQDLLKEMREKITGKKEKSSTDRESICPWESLGTEQPPAKPRTGSPDMTKLPSKKSQSVESLKAEVCPWEAQELEGTDKAEICPWEVAAPPSAQPKAKPGAGGSSKGEKRITRQAALASPERSLEKGSSEREAVCPWESLGTEQPPAKPRTGSPAMPKSPSKKSQSVESLKAEVCPWEAQEAEATDKAEICPWESLGTEQPPAKPRTGSPDMTKLPSKKSQSVESLKAEVCPWEAQELEATDKAEICPWEAAVPPSSKEKPRQGREGLSTVSKSPSTSQDLFKEMREKITGKKEKSSTDRESICPWESLGTEQPPAKPRTGSPDMTKLPSKKSQSVESLKAEVCPWEAQELEATDKAEIWPWEVAAPLLAKGAVPGKASLPPQKAGASKPPEKGSSEHEVICPWESVGTKEFSPKSSTEKELPKKSSSTDSKSDICPWEAAEPTTSEKESFQPGMHPQGEHRASPAATGKSKLVAGASAMSPTALLKKPKGISDGKAEHKPLCRILPGTQPPQGHRAEPLPRGASAAPTVGSSLSPDASIAQVCPWEAEEAPSASDKTSTDTRKTSEVCPWEVESVDPPPTLRRQGRAGASPRDGGRGVSETKPAFCPWDHE
ncbi:probable G-protein coupled receptor 179, partial [Falco naumanni]|uniref:probable G-protein coupled receptor 179 n=1 Tax=Falco naumanni TaxID=148594 RepID=UPI001ADE85DC